MNKNYILIYLLCVCSLSFGQKKSLKRANQLFANKAYVEAAEIYEQLDDSQESLENLGDSYYYNFEMKKASNAYEKLFSKYKDSLNAETYFRYAHALKGIEDYDTGDQIMNEYSNLPENTPQFIEDLTSLVPYNYTIKQVESGSNIGDFGVSYFKDQVVFASLRNTENPKYAWNKNPYLDLYKASVSEDKNLENVEPFSEDINSKTHESNATFTNDGKTMYFSRTNKKRIKIGEEKIAVIKIYRAEFIDSTWTNITVMPFSSDLYSTQHPVLNKENTRLYFSSDMPGALGSFDIFYIDIYANNSYGNPINLGSTINTKHREQFPFITKDSILYFASNGHKGLGGLDLFRSVYKDNNFEEALNLGSTINSGLDDFGFVLKDSLDEGFLSSNRDGKDRLYSFTREPNRKTFFVEGEVRDKNSKEILPGSLVTLLDEDGNIINQMVVGDDAMYKFETEPNKKYQIEGYRSFYIPTIESINTNDEGKIEYDLELEIESYDDAEEIVVTKIDGYIYIELENIYFDLNKWDIKPEAAKTLDVLADLLMKYPRMEIQLGAHTDSRSSNSYNLVLSNNRAKATLNYIVSKGISKERLQSKGFGEILPLVNCGDDCTEVEHSINRRCEFIILK
ncbi:OmpA family protein [Psychroserpens sp. Hel_I_66]|uniref:OmpA family protein n=1 Tax=Psychroserpens sp. Hel_I_66 TaxID=1250004 RepID=UPI0006476512|nr:OmpA family protein [Psychroserpens sp. Hel_I_66]